MAGGKKTLGMDGVRGVLGAWMRWIRARARASWIVLTLAFSVVAAWWIRAKVAGIDSGSTQAAASANASGSHKLGGSALAALLSSGVRDGWSVGTRRDYRADFGSGLQGDTSKPNSEMQLVGSANLGLTCIKELPGRVVLHAELSDVSLTLDQPGSTDNSFVDSIKTAISRPFAVTMSEFGKLESLSVSRDVDAFGHGILRLLISAFQFVEPEKNADWREWTALEADQNGTYRALYQQLEPGRFKKQKLEYTYLEIAARLQLGNALKVEVEGQSLLDRTTRGVLKRVAAKESFALPMGAGLRSQSHATLELVGEHQIQPPELDLAQLDTTMPFESRGARPPSTADKMEEKRKLVGDASFRDMLALLHGIPATKEGDEARYRLRQRMTALFDTDPRSPKDATRELERGLPEKDAQHVLGAFADSEAPEAHAALGDVAQDSKMDRGLRRSAAIQLGLLDHPTEQSISSLREMARDEPDEELRGAAVLSMGSAAHHGGANPATKRAADDIIGQLIKLFYDARTPAERQLYLRALGNTRSVRALEPIRSGMADELAVVRASAVGALRFIPSPEADELIAHALRSDVDEMVRISAIDSATQRPLSPSVAAAATDALKNEQLVMNRLRLVALLSAKLAEAPELRPTLEQVAKNDPSAEVRKAAQEALG